MKKILYLTLILIVCAKASFAQAIKAVTETGEEVILNSDGTWHSASIQKGYTTRLDTLSFTKDKNATFLVKGQKIKYAICVDPKKWKFKSGEDANESGSGKIEYFFTLKGEEAYGMTIPMHTPIKLSAIPETMTVGIKKISEDARVLHEETRKVNGKIIKEMEFACTVNGIKLIYEVYCYSDDNGTIQFYTATSENMYNQYKPELEKLLNGLVIPAE